MKTKLFLFISSVLFFCPGKFSFSQENEAGKLIIDGLVYGYNFDPTKKFLQKEKQIILEGTLKDVSIDISENGKSIYTAKTNKNGGFLLKLNFGKIYKVELSKPGYTKNILIIDVKLVTPEIAANGIRFSGMELILNSFYFKDTSEINIPFGRLYFNPRLKSMDFEANKEINKKGGVFRRDEPNTPVSLMKRAVNKNKSNIQIKKIIVSKKGKEGSVEKENLIENINENDTIKHSNINPEFKLPPNVGIENLLISDIPSREYEIQRARKQLDEDKMNATTLEDKRIIYEREALLNSAVKELDIAKKIIELQQKDISIQKKLLFFATCCLLLLIGFSFLIYKYYREKKKTYILLNAKNKKITESINYASLIQKSILLPENAIKKLWTESFIYYQPRDIVSGDFYWFAEVDEGRQIIIACVDCTGHGVPGAFMSLVGNILLNEIINERHVTQPSAILKLLHAGVLKALHQKEGDSHSQDGMEMSLCVINREKNYIEFSGAMNPIYVVKENSVNIIKPDMQGIGGVSRDEQKNYEVEFTSRIIPIEKNMSVYMFTDGYADQFGGLNNKKFNIKQFKNLLLDIQSMDMETQKHAIEHAMNSWKGNYKQTDDMLVIGLKF